MARSETVQDRKDAITSIVPSTATKQETDNTILTDSTEKPKRPYTKRKKESEPVQFFDKDSVSVVGKVALYGLEKITSLPYTKCQTETKDLFNNGLATTINFYINKFGNSPELAGIAMMCLGLSALSVEALSIPDESTEIDAKQAA